MLGINHYLTTRVLTDPDCVDQTAQMKAKVKTKMGLKESAQFLASSKYIRLLATDRTSRVRPTRLTPLSPP